MDTDEFIRAGLSLAITAPAVYGLHRLHRRRHPPPKPPILLPDDGIHHTEACVTARLARETWERDFPNHCRPCKGWGYTEYSYDPSPAGVSLSAGTMTDSDPCAACSERGRCPRCMRLLIGPFYAHPLRALSQRLYDLGNWLYKKLATPRDQVEVWTRARAFTLWTISEWIAPLPTDPPPCYFCGWNFEPSEQPPVIYDCWCGEDEAHHYSAPTLPTIYDLNRDLYLPDEGAPNVTDLTTPANR